MSLVPATASISPNVGGIYGIKGMDYMVMPMTWAFELLTDGKGMQEHADRYILAITYIGVVTCKLCLKVCYTWAHEYHTPNSSCICRFETDGGAYGAIVAQGQILRWVVVDLRNNSSDMPRQLNRAELLQVVFSPDYSSAKIMSSSQAAVSVQLQTAD